MGKPQGSSKTPDTKKPLPKVAVYSLFRDDSTSYIDRYFANINIIDYPKHLLRFYLVEGDSKTDVTYSHLVYWALKQNLDVWVFQYNTGVPRRVNNRTVRLQALSDTANKALDEIAKDKWADKVLLLESDILFEPDFLRKLVDKNKKVIAPTIKLVYKNKEFFYDLWAFVYANGQRITQTPKEMGSGKLIEMASVGSVVLFDAERVYKGFRFGPRAIKGVGKGWWDTSIEVIHPNINESTGLYLK